MWMQKGSRMYTGILCHGEERTLQGRESDVQLFIPQNVHGLLISSVCTDNSEVSHQIPDDECIIGPMVGFQLHSKYEHDHEPKHHYIITIPHCLEEDSVWDLIKVRKFKSRNTEAVVNITQYDANQEQDTYYYMEEHCIRIYSKHFCDFICSTCGPDLCRDKAMVFFYGSIQPSGDQGTSVIIMPFFCSFLYNITDYREVGQLIKLYLYPPILSENGFVFHRSEHSGTLCNKY